LCSSSEERGKGKKLGGRRWGGGEMWVSISTLFHIGKSQL